MSPLLSRPDPSGIITTSSAVTAGPRVIMDTSALNTPFSPGAAPAPWRPPRNHNNGWIDPRFRVRLPGGTSGSPAQRRQIIELIFLSMLTTIITREEIVLSYCEYLSPRRPSLWYHQRHRSDIRIAISKLRIIYRWRTGREISIRTARSELESELFVERLYGCAYRAFLAWTYEPRVGHEYGEQQVFSFDGWPLAFPAEYGDDTSSLGVLEDSIDPGSDLSIATGGISEALATFPADMRRLAEAVDFLIRQTEGSGMEDESKGQVELLANEHEGTNEQPVAVMDDAAPLHYLDTISEDSETASDNSATRYRPPVGGSSGASEELVTGANNTDTDPGAQISTASEHSTGQSEPPAKEDEGTKQATINEGDAYPFTDVSISSEDPIPADSATRFEFPAEESPGASEQLSSGKDDISNYEGDRDSLAYFGTFSEGFAEQFESPAEEDEGTGRIKCTDGQDEGTKWPTISVNNTDSFADISTGSDDLPGQFESTAGEHDGFNEYFNEAWHSPVVEEPDNFDDGTAANPTNTRMQLSDVSEGSDIAEQEPGYFVFEDVTEAWATLGQRSDISGDSEAPEGEASIEGRQSDVSEGLDMPDNEARNKEARLECFILKVRGLIDRREEVTEARMNELAADAKCLIEGHQNTSNSLRLALTMDALYMMRQRIYRPLPLNAPHFLQLADNQVATVALYLGASP